jgi:outer membrane protein W
VNNIRVAADSDMRGGFGAHVVAGVNVNIAPTWFIGIEGKYLWAKTDSDIETIPGSSFGSHLDGFMGNALIGWRF